MEENNVLPEEDNFSMRTEQSEDLKRTSLFENPTETIEEYEEVYMQKAGPKVDPADPKTIKKFVDELPILETLIPDEKCEGYDYYEIEMKRAKHKFHRDFCETLIYGYNGMYPGPTIEAIKGHAVHVKWINNLPLEHFLPVDKSLHGAYGNPEVRTVVHLHGANVAPDSDGHPDAWFTRNYQFTGPKYSRQVYNYPNDQEATMLWYHDHSLGTTRLNVYAGLAGCYIIHDFNELGLKLPSGKYDIPLVIQDKSFNSDSSLFYPAGPENGPVYPSVVRAFIGQTMVVNGKVWPYLKVEPRKYRFRMLNASNTNGYVIKLSNDQPFYQIGTDGGLLAEPVKLKSFTLDPAERMDVIIDFSELKHGDIVTLKTEEPDLKVDVMQFRVELPLCTKDKSVIPKKIKPLEKLDKDMEMKTRRVVIGQDIDQYGRTMLTLNNRMFNDPATEKPNYDSVEVWEIANPLTPLIDPRIVLAAHPIHLHLVQFQILERQLFDAKTFDADKWIEDGSGIDYVSGIIPPDPSEGGPIPPQTIEQSQRAWKDTVRAEPGLPVPEPTTGKVTGKVTRIIAHFKNFTGEYVWHCHILEHEDHDMMRPLRVIKKYCD